MTADPQPLPTLVWQCHHCLQPFAQTLLPGLPAIVCCCLRCAWLGVTYGER